MSKPSARVRHSAGLELPTGLLDPAHCVLRHVSRTARAVVAAYDAAFAPVGLTGPQFNLLMTLHRCGPCTVGALAAMTGMHGSTVPRAIAPMRERGWVAMTTGRDRRERILHLTEEGQRRLAQALPLWRDLQSLLLERIGPATWKDLTPTLRKVGEAAQAVREGS